MPDTLVWEVKDSFSGSVESDFESGETKNVTRRYVIGKCVGFNDVVAQIEQYAPKYAVDPLSIYWRRQRLNVRGIGNGYFDCTAEYTTLVGGQGGDAGADDESNIVPGTMSFDTSGNTEHITQAITETRYNAPGVSDQDFQKAINVNGESVEGIDIVRPALAYAETWILPVAVATSADFINACYTLTGSVNEDQFRSFQPGEALFMGARGTWSGDQPYVPVEFSFQCRPNETVSSIGEIAGFEKKGWEYVWVRYETQAATGTIFRKPIVAYLNQVYPSKSWDGLLITRQGYKPAEKVNPADVAAGQAALGAPGGGAGIEWGQAEGGFCWLAREVYGVHDPRWIAFRAWMMSDAPAWLRSIYWAIGESAASFVRFVPMLKPPLRWLMNLAIRGRSA